MATTSYGYGPRGNLVKETNGAGDTITYAYGPLGNLDASVDPLRQLTSYVHNQAGELTSVTEPNGQQVTSTYNGAGELTATSYPGSSTVPTTYAYNAAGYLTSITGAGGTDSYAYEPNGQLASTTNPSGATLSYGYDVSGNLVSITYPNGKTLTRGYTPDGQLASVSDWLGHTTSYAYGPDGNLDTEILANGITGNFSYNAVSELTSISYAGPCPKAPPAPGPKGTGPATRSPACPVIYSRNYAYNQDSLLSSSQSPAPPGPPAGSSYGYNPLNELTSVIPAPPTPGPQGQGGTTYSYDPAGNLTSAVSGNENLSLSYNQGFELTSMALSGNRPTSHGASPPDAGGPGLSTPSASFSYSQVGERTGESITGPASPHPPAGPSQPVPTTLSYGYNALGEMTSYNGPMGGSPLSIANVGTPGMPGALTPAPPGSSQATATYTYDPSGLLSSETSTTQVSSPHPACPPISHPSPPAHSTSSNTATFTHTPAFPSCATTTSTAFTWNAASSIPEAIGVGSYAYLYGPGGTPTEQIGPDGSILYYLSNRQGSTIALADQTGHVVARYSYSPYGSLACGPTAPPDPIASSMTQPCGPRAGVPSAPLPSPTRPSPANCPPASAHSPVGPPACLSRAIAANHFLYDGQYLDQTSGLYYLRARWYDPATGEFTSVDALVAITGQPYSYAGGNPLNGGDPSGLWWIWRHQYILSRNTVANIKFWLEWGLVFGNLGDIAGDIPGPAGVVLRLVLFLLGSQATAILSLLNPAYAWGTAKIEFWIGFGAPRWWDFPEIYYGAQPVFPKGRRGHPALAESMRYPSCNVI